MSRPNHTDIAPTGARAVTVSVTLFAGVRRPGAGRGDRHQRLALPAGATVADLLAALGVDRAADVTAAVDGEIAAADTPLRDGAEVMLMNPMEGGAGAATDEDAGAP